MRNDFAQDGAGAGARVWEPGDHEFWRATIEPEGNFAQDGTGTGARVYADGTEPATVEERHLWRSPGTGPPRKTT